MSSQELRIIKKLEERTSEMSLARTSPLTQPPSGYQASYTQMWTIGVLLNAAECFKHRFCTVPELSRRENREPPFFNACPLVSPGTSSQLHSHSLSISWQSSCQSAKLNSSTHYPLRWIECYALKRSSFKTFFSIRIDAVCVHWNRNCVTKILNNPFRFVLIHDDNRIHPIRKY